jgi:hypothetical protein
MNQEFQRRMLLHRRVVYRRRANKYLAVVYVYIHIDKNDDIQKKKWAKEKPRGVDRWRRSIKPSTSARSSWQVRLIINICCHVCCAHVAAHHVVQAPEFSVDGVAAASAHWILQTRLDAGMLQAAHVSTVTRR